MSEQNNINQNISQVKNAVTSGTGNAIVKKGFSRDTRKLGHVVKLCYADVCKCLILRCFNTSSSAPPPAKTSPKTTIYGQV
jgi:hypothetical protein